MLLETLDVRKKDVLIYSQNKFDFSDNFRIVYKSNENKRPRKISYFDVCEFVKDPNPKNLIVYRLLTNVENLDAYSTKYGYFIKINGHPELIYFDPVFAIKDIRHLRFDFEPEEFRFKIQQIGLASRKMQAMEADYEEVFGFDLKANEAKNQNDKIFADAIFAFDDSYVDEDEITEEELIEEKLINKDLEKDFKGKLINDLKNISEVSHEKKSRLNKAYFDAEDKSTSIRDEKINMLKKALGIEKSKSKYQDDLRQGVNNNDNFASVEQNLFDLFKTTSKFSDINSRKNDSFILKLGIKN